MFDFQLILSYTVFWTTRDLFEMTNKLPEESDNSSSLLVFGFAFMVIQTAGDVNN